MRLSDIALIFFFYGLAFFSMGLAILLEVGRGDARLKHALRTLAAFGLVHGGHEWLEMFLILGLLPMQETALMAWESVRIVILALSFLALGAFGASLLSPNERLRRLSLLVPLVQSLIWGAGMLTFPSRYPIGTTLWDVADVWTRYVLALPSALLACAGLIAQQRVFRRVGMAQFGRDSLWAAMAFAWYGVIGQTFTRASPLPPSSVINSDLFLKLFGFPVQLLRAAAAIVAAVFVMRFLRAFEVETQHQIADLQAARLREAERRETLRGELLKRVVTAQEAERQRIARELHDETGQALTAIGMGLRAVGTTLRDNPDKAARNLRHLEGLTDRSLNELQRLIADLRPSHLDDLGLPAALRWYAGEVENRAPLEVSVEVLGEEPAVSSQVKTILFRVAQEALTNVVKHANARRTKVQLTFGSKAASLLIEDDGQGFDTGMIAMADRPTWGLMGMQERVSLLGGHFRLTSHKGMGTQIEVTIPYDEDTEAEHDHSLAVGG